MRKDREEYQQATFAKYVAFKIRFLQSRHLLYAKRAALKAYEVPIRNQEGGNAAITLQTASYVSLAALVDTHKESVNVFRLARRCIPQDAEYITEAEKSIERGLVALRRFRDSCGAHTDNLNKLLWAVRELDRNKDELEQAGSLILTLGMLLIERERQILPDYEERSRQLLKEWNLTKAFERMLLQRDATILPDPEIPEDMSE
jgi:hypothetical protein